MKKLSEKENLQNEIKSLKQYIGLIKSRYTRNKRMKVALVVMALVIVPLTMIYSATISKPYNFNSGTVASSSEVNENFDELYTKVNSIDSALEGLSISGGSMWIPDGVHSHYYDESGNLLLGSTSITPQYKLEVVNNLGNTSGAKVLSQFYRGVGAGDNSGVKLGYYADGTDDIGGLINSTDNKPLFIGTESNNRALTILNNGNVGIGTTNPGSKFVLDADENAINLVRICSNLPGLSNGAPAIVLSRHTGVSGYNSHILSELYDGSTGGFGLSFNTTSGEHSISDFGDAGALSTRMFIGYNGNVGIGTTSPKAKLDVEGSGMSALFKTYTVWTNPIDQSIYMGAANGDAGNAGSVVGWRTRVSGSTITSFTIESGISAGYTSNLPDTFTERFRIKYDGNVGIGTSNPEYLLDVNGQARINGTIHPVSDIKLKNRINSIENKNNLNKITSLRGVNYYWKDEKSGKGKQLGVIAQEVEKVFPELVITANDGLKSVNYNGFVAPLIEAIKELKSEKDKEISQIKAENEKLRAENESLRKKFNSFEIRISAIEGKRTKHVAKTKDILDDIKSMIMSWFS